METVHPYILDNASTAEYQRLDLMSKILDPRTRASLASMGLRDGWNCLELGGGNGSMTEWLCRKVGYSGSVTSVDLNPVLIKLVPAQNLTVRQADLRNCSNTSSPGPNLNKPDVGVLFVAPITGDGQMGKLLREVGLGPAFDVFNPMLPAGAAPPARPGVRDHVEARDRRHQRARHLGVDLRSQVLGVSRLRPPRRPDARGAGGGDDRWVSVFWRAGRHRFSLSLHINDGTKKESGVKPPHQSTLVGLTSAVRFHTLHSGLDSLCRGAAMKLVRLLLAVLAIGGMTGLAYVAQQTDAAGPDQVSAASAFVDSLTPEQKQLAAYPYDSDERFDWNFTPQQDKKGKMATRKGIAMGQAGAAEQKQRGSRFLKAGTSRAGDETAQAIMNLENVLKAAEKNGAMVRTPDRAFPHDLRQARGKTGKMGLLLRGASHVDQHDPRRHAGRDRDAVLLGLQTERSTEAPVAKVPLLPPRSWPPSSTIRLTPSRRKRRRRRRTSGSRAKRRRASKVGSPTGLAYSKMSADQKSLLVKLLDHYTMDRMPKDIGDREMKMVTDAGLDNIFFSYHGSTKDGEKRSYRIQGPTFVVEFLNVQADSFGNPANHIHSAWRRIKGDFGLN